MLAVIVCIILFAIVIIQKIANKEKCLGDIVNYSIAIIFIIIVNVAVNVPNGEIIHKEPLVQIPRAIAVSNKYIYLNDNISGKILVYDKNMKFNSYINYREFGNNVIYCDESGLLCRYDPEFKILIKYNIETNEYNSVTVDDYIAPSNKISAVNSGVEYKLKSRIIGRSKVIVTTDNQVTVYSVGKLSYLLLFYVILIAFIVFFGWNLYRSVKSFIDTMIEKGNINYR